MNATPLNFTDVYEAFEREFFALPKSFTPRKVNEHLYFIGPHDGETIDLCVSCLVHGNELGGMVAITKLLQLLQGNDISFSKKIAILVGNKTAAEQSVRFVDRDLNRSFGRNTAETREDQMARMVEPFLTQTRFIIDLHQTKYRTLSDFFIFPQHRNNIRFAWHLGKDVPIVVHENQFSVDGMCLDSFVTLNGGVGVTYEMGPVEDTELQLHKTLRLLSRALSLQSSNFPLNAPLPSSVFVFDQVLMAEPGVNLKPNLVNFVSVKKGDAIADKNGQSIVANINGHILFPKYGKEAQNSSELCRLIRSVPLEESFQRESIFPASL